MKTNEERERRYIREMTAVKNIGKHLHHLADRFTHKRTYMCEAVDEIERLYNSVSDVSIDDDGEKDVVKHWLYK